MYQMTECIEKQRNNGVRHSSVNLSMLTILRTSVRISSTAPKLFPFIFILFTIFVFVLRKGLKYFKKRPRSADKSTNKSGQWLWRSWKSGRFWMHSTQVRIQRIRYAVDCGGPLSISTYRILSGNAVAHSSAVGDPGKSKWAFTVNYLDIFRNCVGALWISVRDFLETLRDYWGLHSELWMIFWLLFRELFGESFSGNFLALSFINHDWARISSHLKVLKSGLILPQLILV